MIKTFDFKEGESVELLRDGVPIAGKFKFRTAAFGPCAESSDKRIVFDLELFQGEVKKLSS